MYTKTYATATPADADATRRRPTVSDAVSRQPARRTAARKRSDETFEHGSLRQNGPM